jgi:hypothetical protein
VADRAIGGDDLEAALDVLSARVVGFSPARVAEAARRTTPLACSGAVAG